MCLVSLTIPGTRNRPQDSDVLAKAIGMFEKHGIEGSFCDTVAGWGCLNQDWWEAKCEMDTSWDWCLPSAFGQEEKKDLLSMLEEGSLLMMIHYADGKGTPHN